MRSNDRRQIASAAYLRRRRGRRSVLIAAIAIFVATVVFSHLRSGDDWARFNHRRFPVIEVLGGDTLIIQSNGGQTETVRLLGIVAPDEGVGSVSRKSLSELAEGRDATLLLAMPQSRDEKGCLLASVFVDGSNVGVELARAGMVYADRRIPGIMSGAIDPAETEARKKKRGLWADLKFDRMPAWRQAWVRGLGNKSELTIETLNRPRHSEGVIGVVAPRHSSLSQERETK